MEQRTPIRERRLCVRLTDDEMGVLEAISQERHISVAQIVRGALAASVSSPNGNRGAELTAQ